MSDTELELVARMTARDKTEEWDMRPDTPIVVTRDYSRTEQMDPAVEPQVSIRVFETGATRDQNQDKLDYSGFLSPLALQRFAQYMHKHRRQADGSMRASDNWKKGIPIAAYKESMIRHVVEWWKLYEQNWSMEHSDELEELACAILFNVQGFLHESAKARQRSPYFTGQWEMGDQTTKEN